MEFILHSTTEQVIKKLEKEDASLLASIINKMELLRDGKKEMLDLKPIHRSNGKYQINEIRIHNPGEVRVFYSTVDINGKKIVIVDIKRKKQQRFDSNYFKILDKRIAKAIEDNE